jgi:type IV pilus assembly protein PilA
MILKLRQRMAQDESGFTLVELLVVMLILGLLAAIAIPAFFNQQSKAKDADAKSAVRTAETAMETFFTSNNGSYAPGGTAATPADLQAIEPTLNDAPNLEVLAATDKSYTISTQSTGDNQNYYEISRADDGTTTLSCGTTQGTPTATGNTPGTDGCPTGGNWGAG